MEDKDFFNTSEVNPYSEVFYKAKENEYNNSKHQILYQRKGTNNWIPIDMPKVRDVYCIKLK